MGVLHAVREPAWLKALARPFALLDEAAGLDDLAGLLRQMTVRAGRRGFPRTRHALTVAAVATEREAVRRRREAKRLANSARRGTNDL